MGVVCNGLAEHYQQPWKYHRKYQAYTSTIETTNKHIYLLKSMHPMNINGKSVAKAIKDLDISTKDIILLHDDLERALGKLSWKSGGSAGGHNGVKFVIASLDEDQIRRLRIGIGRPVQKGDVSDYVLKKFSRSEMDVFDVVVDQAVAMLVHEFIET